MKYNFFKWCKIPKKGLCKDASGTAILLKRGAIWYLSNTEIITEHCHKLSPSHFMILPGLCLNWTGPYKIEKIINHR